MSPTLHPLLARLIERADVVLPAPEAIDETLAAPGHRVLFFTEEPERYRETLDVAVVLPELLDAAAVAVEAVLLLPLRARALAPRFGVRRWPALVLLRDGGYLGAIEGVRDWAEYLHEFNRLLSAPVGRAPTIGVAVSASRME